MNFICSKQKLQEGISIVTKAITGKTTMPILEGIYIEANNEGVTLIGSDMDVSIETKVEATVITPGKIVLDARLFGEIIRKLPNSDVKIEIADNDLIQVTCEKSVFNLVYMNPSDYPMLPTINEDLKVEVPQNLLKNMIKGTSFAIAQDEVRPILQGILFEVKDKQLNLVALDGYRLAIRNELLDIDNDIEVVIPGKTLNEISKILNGGVDDIVNIYFTTNHILFEFDNTLVVSRLIEGEYFKINQMLSSDYETKVVINKREMLDCIDRATLLIKEGDKKPIIITIKDGVMEFKINSFIGSMDEEIYIQKEGKDMMIGFNPRFLIDTLKVIDEEQINIYYVNPKSPCFIRDDEGKYIYLILPVNFSVANN